MNETKSILASKTIWGVVIAALPSLLGLFGFNIGDVASFSEQANAIVDGLLQLVGSVMAIYGRIVAAKALVVKK